MKGGIYPCSTLLALFTGRGSPFHSGVVGGTSIAIRRLRTSSSAAWGSGPRRNRPELAYVTHRESRRRMWMRGRMEVKEQTKYGTSLSGQATMKKHSLCHNNHIIEWDGTVDSSPLPVWSRQFSAQKLRTVPGAKTGRRRRKGGKKIEGRGEMRLCVG